MNQSYQNKASDQICKIQNDKKLISFHDRLRAAPNTSYAQLHAQRPIPATPSSTPKGSSQKITTRSIP